MKAKLVQFSALAALAIMISGCVSEVGYEAGTSSYAQCRAAAWERYPPKPVLNQEPGYIGDRWVPCGDGSSRLCPPASASYYADQGTYWDYNRTPRQLFLRRCLSG